MKSRVIRNYIYNTLYNILVIIAPLITTPYISRVLESDGVGIYSYTYSIAYAFSLFAALGFNTYGQREVAYYQDDKQKRSEILFKIIYMRIISTAVVSAVYIILSLLYKEYSTYLLLQYFIIAAVALDISWYYQGLENFKAVAARNIFVKLVNIVLIFLLVKTKDDVWKYILINSISNLASNLLYFWNITKFTSKASINFNDIKKYIKGGLEFFVPLVAVQIYSQLDKIMLGILVTGNAENGYYEQARKITSLIVTIIVSLNTVLMPRVSNLYSKGEKDRILDYFKESFKFMILLLAPICIGLFIVAPNFTSWFFGQGYDKVTVLLRISSLLIVFMCVGNFVGVQFLSPTGKQNQMTIAYIIAAIVNLILNSLLIPSLLSIGALIASVIAESVSCFIQVGLLKKSEYNFSLTQGIWKYIISAMTMGIVILVFDKMTGFTRALQTFFEVIVGVISYFMLLVILKDDLVYLSLKKLRHNEE